MSFFVKAADHNYKEKISELPVRLKLFASVLVCSKAPSRISRILTPII